MVDDDLERRKNEAEEFEEKIKQDIEEIKKKRKEFEDRVIPKIKKLIEKFDEEVTNFEKDNRSGIMDGEEVIDIGYMDMPEEQRYQDQKEVLSNVFNKNFLTKDEIKEIVQDQDLFEKILSENPIDPQSCFSYGMIITVVAGYLGELEVNINPRTIDIGRFMSSGSLKIFGTPASSIGFNMYGGKIEVNTMEENVIIANIGEGMSAGEIFIEGTDIYGNVGEEMEGGEISLLGNVYGEVGNTMKVLRMYEEQYEFENAFIRIVGEVKGDIGTDMVAGEIMIHGIIYGDVGAYTGRFDDDPDFEKYEHKIGINGAVTGRVGTAMQKGIIKIEGNVFRDVGFGMGGGNILIKGNVGDFTGAEMKGGIILIEGKAGDALGFGMKGGKINLKPKEGIDSSHAGNFVGGTMSGGYIDIQGYAGKDLGLEKTGGNIKVSIKNPTEERVEELEKYVSEMNKYVSEMNQNKFENTAKKELENWLHKSRNEYIKGEINFLLKTFEIKDIKAYRLHCRNILEIIFQNELPKLLNFSKENVLAKAEQKARAKQNQVDTFHYMKYIESFGYINNLGPYKKLAKDAIVLNSILDKVHFRGIFDESERDREYSAMTATEFLVNILRTFESIKNRKINQNKIEFKNK